MVEREAADLAENCGIADLGGRFGSPFASIKIHGLVEKPSLEDSSSGLALVEQQILPSKVLELFDNTAVGVGGEIQLRDALDKLLKLDGLNVLETYATTFDCGN